MSKQLKEVASISSHIWTLITIVGGIILFLWMVFGHVQEQRQDIADLQKALPRLNVTEDLAQKVGRRVMSQEAINLTRCREEGSKMPPEYCKGLELLQQMEGEQ